jgi:pimeloyl-ACP methyl ester carboxylesterase
MVTSNPAVLTKAPKATMVAADGVTLLLLRFTSAVPGSVKYTIGGDTCDAATFTRTDDGGLSAWGAEDRLDSITQHTIAVGSQHQAFGVYHAPTDFARTAADDNLRYRPLTLRAQFTPDSGATSTLCTALQITRPPLVLIHGIWSDQYTWTLPLIGDNRFRIQPVSWDGYTSIANNQNTAYYAGVWPALSDARAWGIAVTQVDVIGHSMGGLLARAWAGGASYKRADNYSKGDYHKVITLNTPHIGSPLATKIISLRSEIGAPFVYGCQLLQKPISPCPASQIVGFFWNATCGPGAIDDLQKNSSVLRALPVPDVPTHAFVGEAGVLRAGGCLTALSALAKAVSIFHNLGDVDALSMDAFGETTHDQLVGSVSQGGGLGNSAISISQSCDSAHTKATTSSDYSTKIIALLNKKASDPAFGRINVNQMLQASDDRASTTTYRAVAAAVSSMTVTITSPADGALVDGASPLEVLVSVSGGIARMVTLLGDRIVLDKSDLPYQFTVNLPEDALGNESLFAVAQGTDGSVAFSAPVSVKVRRNTTIDSLQLDATSRTLLFPGNNQLHVNATFSDGIIRDVTGPGLSTTYKSDDESIVSVSGTGVMTAKRPGVTVVTAHNGAAEAATFVLVVPAPGLKRRAVLP